MSGSPKYSSVSVSPAYAQREAERRRRQAAARRAREQERARERAALAARRAQEAAARRERARAEGERRRAELEARRQAERDAQVARTRQEQAGAEARRLDEVAELIARTSAPGAELGSLERRLAQLRERAARGEQLGDAVEELRGQVVVLRAAGERPAPRTDRAGVLAGLERRLAETGEDGAAHDAEGRQRCLELLDRLRAATGPGQEVRFEALLGTVEHALVRHTTAVAHAAETVRRQAEADRERAEQERRRAEARAAEQAAAEEAERERAQALEAALAEAADRLGVVRKGAEDAAADAVELGAPGLADRVEGALRAVTDALSARRAPEALAAVEALEELLPGAEAQLDELQLAYTRRSDLAQALKDAMSGEGFAFGGGEDQGRSFLLRFERPSGAVYDTTVATEADGTPVLVYRVEGEPDVTLRPAAEGAVCDRTEDLLERVHEAMSEDDGFVPGELTWQGKPPGRRAKRLPGDGAARRWTTP
ncbi:hypothetical protein ACIPSA_34820 [Streptomyces sp. NPDC086549]|uniref:hypothetical protein n=1 Tax=Streptomyces sp. NPDC086549 TaxID=3365752 RepID=UPI0038130AD2